MLKRLAKDTLVYSASSLLVRGVQIVLIPIYTRALSSGNYGMVETLTILGALVNLTIALEISQGVARFLADAEDHAERRRLASTAFWFGVFAYGLFFAVMYVFSQQLSALIFDSGAHVDVLKAGIAALAVNGVFALLQDMLRWQLRPVAYLQAALVYTVVNASVGIYCVGIAGNGVVGVFYGQLAGAASGLAVAVLASLDIVAFQFDRERLARMLSFSAPLALSGLAVFGSLFADRVVVKEILGLDQLGIYGVAARFASIVSIATVGLQAALSPLVYRNHRDPATAMLLSRAFRFYGVAMVLLVGSLALFSGEIIFLGSGPSFQEGRLLLPLLALSALLSTLYIFFPGLYLSGKTFKVALANAGAGIANVVLNLLLVPHWGVVGAAAATCIAATCAFLVLALPGQRLYPVPIQPIRSTAIFLILAALVGLGMAWNALPSSLDGLQFATKSLVLILALAIASAVGLDSEDRRALRNKVKNYAFGRQTRS